MLNGALHSRGFNITYPGLWLKIINQQNMLVPQNIPHESPRHHSLMGECDCSPGAAEITLRWD